MMEIRDWLLTISMIGHFAYTGWAYIERRNDKTNERIAALTNKVDEVERNVAGLRQAVDSAPSHGDLSKVYESINGLAATVHQLVGENRGQTDTLRLILSRMTGERHG